MTSSERRRAASESLSARYGAARNNAVQHCADFFERSGVHYDCLKTVQDTVAPELARIAMLDEYRNYNVNTTRTLRRIGDEVHNRWKART